MAFPILPLDLLFSWTKHSKRPLKQSVFTKLPNSQHLIKLINPKTYPLVQIYSALTQLIDVKFNELEIIVIFS